MGRGQWTQRGSTQKDTPTSDAERPNHGERVTAESAAAGRLLGAPLGLRRRRAGPPCHAPSDSSRTSAVLALVPSFTPCFGADAVVDDRNRRKADAEVVIRVQYRRHFTRSSRAHSARRETEAALCRNFSIEPACEDPVEDGKSRPTRWWHHTVPWMGYPPWIAVGRGSD
jgi:hypothetical protein